MLDINSLDSIKQLIELGANPRSEDDTIFTNMTKWNKTSYDWKSIIDYLVYDCKCDINTQKSICLINAMENDRPEIFTYFLELGTIITPKVIKYSIH